MIAAALLIAGSTLVAGAGYADEVCTGFEFWNKAVEGACNGRAFFNANNLNQTNAAVAARLDQDPTGNGAALIVGLTINFAPISGCHAFDEAADGQSVVDDTGCKQGRFYQYTVFDNLIIDPGPIPG